MLQDHANSPSTVSTRHSRKSTGDTEFFALNLYAEKGIKIEEAVRIYNADENHNGIKIDPVSVDKSSAADATPSVPLKKRRTLKIEDVSPSRKPPAKRSKRDSSVPSTVDVEVAPPKGTSGKSAGKAAVAKTTEKRKGGTTEETPSTSIVTAVTRRVRSRTVGMRVKDKTADMVPKKERDPSVEKQPTEAVDLRRERSRTVGMRAKDKVPKKERDPSVEKQPMVVRGGRSRTVGMRTIGNAADKLARDKTTGGKTAGKLDRSQSADKSARVKKRENPIEEREKEAENGEEKEKKDVGEIKKTPAVSTRRQTATNRATVKHEIVTDDGMEKETLAPKNGEMKGDEDAQMHKTPARCTRSKSKMMRERVKKEIPTVDGRKEETPAIEMNDGQEEEMERQIDPEALPSMRSSDKFVEVGERLSSAIKEMGRLNNPYQLPMTRETNLVKELVEVVTCSTEKTQSEYDNVMHNLMMAENYIKSGEALPNPNPALQDKIASLEAEKNEWEREKTELTEKMNKTLADRQKEIKMANKKAKEAREEKDNLQQEIQALQAQLNRYMAVVPYDAASSSSHSSLSDAPGPSARPANNKQLGCSTPGYIRDLLRMQGMPKGGAVGHSRTAGWATDVIAGIGHLEGMEEALASVDTKAATVPGYDEYGNSIQQTIRTTVETIAVPEGMSVAQLQAMGYQIVGQTGGDDEDESEFESENGEEDRERDGPLIEEVE